MRPCALIVALALVPLGGCFVDAGPGEGGPTGTTGGGTTGAVTTGDGTTGDGTTGSESTTTGSVTTESLTSGSSSETGSTTTGVVMSTGDASTGGPIGPPCAADYGTEFSDDPGGDWQVLTPTWTWDQAMGLYRGATMSDLGATTRLHTGSWADVRVITRLRVAANSVGGVVLRYGGPGPAQYMYVEIDAVNKELAVYRGATKQTSFGKYELAGVWVDLEVSFVGTTVAFSMNGKQIANGIQIVDLMAGGVGLLARSGTVEADSFYVCPVQ